MRSSFFGLNIATQGLYTYQTALNVTSHNIANSGVDGYSRQYAEIQATRALPNSTRGMVGTGAEVLTVKQYRSTYLDEKLWSMNTKLGEYSVKEEMLGQIEMLLREPSDSGYSSYFSDMFDRLQDLSVNPGDDTARMNFVESAESFTEYFNNLSDQLDDYQRDANFGVKTSVEQINYYSSQLAAVNNQIQNLELNQNVANDLRDERVRLLDELSQIISIKTQEITDINGKNTFKVSIAGQTLVEGNEANYLVAVPREGVNNPNDIPDIYDVYWENLGSNDFYGDITAGAGTTTITVENFDFTDISTVGDILIDGVTYYYNDAEYDEIADTMTFNLNSAPPVGASGVQIMRPDIARKLDLTNPGLTGELIGYMEVRDGNNNQYFTGNVTAGAGTDSITVGGLTSTDLPSEGVITIDNGQYHYDGISYNEITGEMTFTIDDVHTPPVGVTDVIIGEAVSFKGIPHYKDQLNTFVRTVAKAFNNIHEQGNGGAASNLFSFEGYTGVPDLDENSEFSYNQLTIGNFTVDADILSNYDQLATTSDPNAGESAQDLLIEMLELRHDVDMFEQGEADSYMQSVIAEMAVDGAKVMSFREGQQNLTQMVINQRESFSAVDLNEETTDLIRFEQAYQLSAKMIQVMDEVYDVMINQLKR